jgi:Ca2+:H+ antiporter
MSVRAGEGVGSQLNATFGNAAELIIGLVALSKGLTGVVKASITGSIIGNLLLVLGVCMFAGGLRFARQTFNQAAARAFSTSLGLAAIELITPTIFHRAADHQPAMWSPQVKRYLSLAIASVLLLTYILFSIFSLVSHKAFFVGPGSDQPQSNDAELATWSIVTSCGQEMQKV